MVHCFLCDDNAEVTNFEDSTQLTAISAPLSYKRSQVLFWIGTLFVEWFI